MLSMVVRKDYKPISDEEIARAFIAFAEYCTKRNCLAASETYRFWRECIATRTPPTSLVACCLGGGEWIGLEAMLAKAQGILNVAEGTNP